MLLRAKLSKKTKKTLILTVTKNYFLRQQKKKKIKKTISLKK